MGPDKFFVNVRGKQISLTKLSSFQQWNESGKKESQEIRTLVFLNTVPSATSRQIAKALQVERTSITRILANLQQKKEIKVLKIDKCPITAKKVNWYALTSDQERKGYKEQEEKKKQLEQAQTVLFSENEMKEQTKKRSYLENW